MWYWKYWMMPLREPIRVSESRLCVARFKGSPIPRDATWTIRPDSNEPLNPIPDAKRAASCLAALSNQGLDSD